MYSYLYCVSSLASLVNSCHLLMHAVHTHPSVVRSPTSVTCVRTHYALIAHKKTSATTRAIASVGVSLSANEGAQRVTRPKYTAVSCHSRLTPAPLSTHKTDRAGGSASNRSNLPLIREQGWPPKSRPMCHLRLRLCSILYRRRQSDGVHERRFPWYAPCCLRCSAPRMVSINIVTRVGGRALLLD